MQDCVKREAVLSLPLHLRVHFQSESAQSGANPLMKDTIERGCDGEVHARMVRGQGQTQKVALKVASTNGFFEHSQAQSAISSSR